MIRHEIKLHSNYQLKSFIESHDGILITQEFYNKNGQPIKTHIKGDIHITYKNGKPIKTKQYWENTNILRFVEEIKYGYNHITEFNIDGIVFRKAKFKYNLRESHKINGVDYRYNLSGYIERVVIYKNGKLTNNILYDYHLGTYTKNFMLSKRIFTKPITPKILHKIAPTWEQDFKNFTIGTKCDFLANSFKFSVGVITKRLNWFQVEITDEYGEKNIIPLYYVSID
jgi:antitoxin component YwqK of YwqJK toxin-antitoxin module